MQLGLAKRRLYSVCPLPFAVLLLALLGCRGQSPNNKTVSGLSDNAKLVIHDYGNSPLDSLLVRFQDSSYSMAVALENNRARRMWVIRNQSFLLNQYAAPGGRNLIVSQNVEWVKGPWEGNSPWLTATGIEIDETGAIRRLWSIAEEADEGKFAWDFYLTSLYGCCDAENTYRIHSLRDGRLVMAYNHDLLHFHVDSRFIGALEEDYFRLGGYEESELSLAVINLASEDSCLHSLMFRATNDSIIQMQGDCGLGHCTISLIPRDSALLEVQRHPDSWFLTSTRSHAMTCESSGMLKVTFDCETPVFVIPFENDSFLIENRIFPGYEIVLQK